MKKQLLFIPLVAFAACSKPSKPVATNAVEMHEVVQKMRPFGEVIGEINTLELPITFWCGSESHKSASDYGLELVELAPKDAVVIGKLPPKEGKEYIIYGEVGDIIYPYMYTYDDEGQLLDSLYLHIGVCVGDDELVISNSTVINEDYTVNMVDTTMYVHYDADFITEYIDSMVVTNRTMALGNDGLYTLRTLED